MVIGVDRQRQKQGIGQLMMEHFDRLLLSKGFGRVSLSKSSDNKRANRAFQKASYVFYKTAHGANYYFKPLTEEF